MSIDKQRIAAVRKLQELGYVFDINDGWLTKAEAWNKEANKPKYGNASVGAIPIQTVIINSWEIAYKNLYKIYSNFPQSYTVSIPAVVSDIQKHAHAAGLVL